MYCSNCGKQIPDGSRFCSSCGAQTAGSSQPQQNQSQPRQTYAQNPQSYAQSRQKAPKKAPVWVSILVGIVAFAVGYGVVSGMLSGDDSASGSSTYTPVVTEAAAEAPANAAYEEVFSSHYIVDMPSIFFMLDSAHFVSEAEDGTIEKLEFGYDGDLIKEMVNVVYLPIGEYTEEEKTEIDILMKETFAQHESYDFITASYQMGSQYYVITLRCTNLDNEDNMKVMQALGFTEDDCLLSMAATEEGLLDSGYIKR